MGKFSSVFFIVFIITLFSPIFCRSSHHEHHYDKNWISFLPAIYSVVNFTADDSTIQDEISANGSSDSSTPTVLMSDTYNDNNSSRGVVVGVPIGGIILFILICYCCYRCFCRPRVVVQGATIIRTPAPQAQAQVQAPIVIQNVTNAPAQPPQYPPPYPPTYEMGHPPTHYPQHAPPPQQYYPDGGGYNPNAPPQYGRY